MKKILLVFRDIFEIYLPVSTFIIMFLTFILQVFFRYVIRYPLTWTMEIIVIGFIWTVEFGACYTMRKKSHVKFTMLYDRLQPKPAALTRLLGNVIIAGTFLWLVPGSWIQGVSAVMEKTAALRIPHTILFMPFVYFLISVACYTGVEIVEDIKVLMGSIPDSEDHGEAFKALSDLAEAAQ